MSLIGQVLDGKYAIVRRIAEGGTSTVYLGVNQRIGKDVAVKVLRSVVASDPEAVERFEREARIVSRIRSPHVADVFDYGELPSGERFMVMEYLEGESLAKLIQRDERMAPAMLGAIAVQILDALAAAHSIGVVHRDLKPENVLVAVRRGELVVKVVDFGISKIVATDVATEKVTERALASAGLSTKRVSLVAGGATGGADLSRVTAAGSVLGTPLYMSPEQACGETAAIDHRTDIYSLGVILYEALCGEPPLTGEDMNELLFRIALDEPESLLARDPTLDPDLVAIVERALAKEPKDRYQTADEMRAAIEAWRTTAASSIVVPAEFVSEVALPAVTERPTGRMRERIGRVRRWAMAALFAAIGIGASASLLHQGVEASEPIPPAPPPSAEKAPAELSTPASSASAMLTAPRSDLRQASVDIARTTESSARLARVAIYPNGMPPRTTLDGPARSSEKREK